MCRGQGPEHATRRAISRVKEKAREGTSDRSCLSLSLNRVRTALLSSVP